MNREDFEVLKNYVYLDSGATALKPSIILDPIKKYYLELALNLSTFSSLPCYKNLLMLVYVALIISKIYFARI